MYTKKAPHVVSIKAGESIYICQCGKTQNSPRCDGSHQKEGTKTPLAHQADKEGDLYICGCGQSKNMPWCDGTHTSL